MESQLLQGKVAIGTGSSYGMGRSIAELFAEEGAAVVLTAHGREKLDIAVRELADKGYRVAGVCADVRSYEDTQRVFATAIEKFGDLDILVNNTGIGDMILIDETTDESVANVMNVNVKPPRAYARGFLPWDSGRQPCFRYGMRQH